MVTLLIALLLLAQPPDESAALNVLLKPGAVVTLEPRAYGIVAPLDGTVPNVTLKGSPAATRLVKLPGATSGIVNLDGGRTYEGWTFEGIEFQGGARALAGTGQYFSLTLSGTRGIRFKRCRFRDLFGPVHVRDSGDVIFEDCDFFGTVPGVFAPGVRDPDAVPGATYGSGLSIDEQCRAITVSRCRFHFCESGLGVNARPFQSVDGLTVEGCSFRADWWDSPGAVLRFAASKVTYAAGTAPRVTVDSGGFKGFIPGQVVSFRRDRATGAAFSRVYAGQVGIDGDAFGRAAVGDVIETGDGRRGRIGAVESPNSVWVDGWEAADTYEPCGQPAPATAWRLSRYYACGIAAVFSDTEFSLYFEPVCPYTAERAVTEAKLDLPTLPARVLPRTIYSGLGASGAVRGLLVSGCTFRGGWADQCSAFDLPEGARILGNRFLCGQDEGITLTRCPGSVVANNVFINSGVSAVSIGGSDGSAVVGNVVRNWGVVNYNPGAIDAVRSRSLSVQGNTFSAAAAAARDWCRYAVSFREGDCSGSVVAGDADGASTVGSVYADKVAAPKLGAIVVRDAAKGVAGAGKANVLVK